MDLREFAVKVGHRTKGFTQGRFVLLTQDLTEVRWSKKVLEGPHGLTLWQSDEKCFFVSAEEEISPLLLLGASNDVFIHSRREVLNNLELAWVKAAREVLLGLVDVMKDRAET